MPGLTFQGGLTVAETRYNLTQSQLQRSSYKTGFQGSGGSRLSLAPLDSASFSGTYTRHLTEPFRRGSMPG